MKLPLLTTKRNFDFTFRLVKPSVVVRYIVDSKFLFLRGVEKTIASIAEHHLGFYVYVYLGGDE